MAAMSLVSLADADEHSFKVLVVGDVCVGKTSLVHRYVHRAFVEGHKHSVGADFGLRTLKFTDNHSVRLQLWDIAGNEIRGLATRHYYKNAHAAIIVYDVARPATRGMVEHWLADLRRGNPAFEEQDLPVLVLANKCDLAVSPGDVERDVRALAKQLGLLAGFRCSAKLNLQLDESMDCLVAELMRREMADMDLPDAELTAKIKAASLPARSHRASLMFGGPAGSSKTLPASTQPRRRWWSSTPTPLDEGQPPIRIVTTDLEPGLPPRKFSERLAACCSGGGAT